MRVGDDGTHALDHGCERRGGRVGGSGADFEGEWRRLAQGLAATAPGTTRAVKAVIAAAAPSGHPKGESDPTAAFVRLWIGDAHWAAVAARDEKRRAGSATRKGRSPIGRW